MDKDNKMRLRAVSLYGIQAKTPDLKPCKIVAEQGVRYGRSTGHIPPPDESTSR